ncbi:hypothetical protein JKP88DRAFT_271470 [Tribonema minus]|uniref:Tudor domain-containing protein n=1 Tax=Tribonema minus TaxID=303371 RepID=A0A835ZJP1_9STRA|nr:hypothetical protein JKP88DRAFT_271470 [Tribonema minus]
MQYYGTMLPRIPVPIERKMKVHLLLHQEKKKRAAANQAIKDRLRAGVKVRAIYADEENDPAWYEAVIDAVERADDEGVPDSYWVTFPEYGNASLVGLGEIQLLESKDESRSRSRDPHRDRERAERRERRDEADRDKERGGGGGSGGEKRRRDDSKERGGGAGARHRGRRDDSRERERRRRGSRSRSDSRSRGGGESSGGGARKHARRGSRSRSRSRGRHEGRGGGGARGGGGGGGGDAGGFTGSILDNPDALYAQVVENDRKASTAVGKDYASRPTSYKGSLSLKADRFTVRRKSSSRSPDRARAAAAAGGAARGRSRSPPPRAEPRREPAKITAESLRKAEALKRKYGDASAKM